MSLFRVINLNFERERETSQTRNTKRTTETEQNKHETTQQQQQERHTRQEASHFNDFSPLFKRALFIVLFIHGVCVCGIQSK